MEIERKWLVDEDIILPLLTRKTKRVKVENHYINGSTEEWIIRASKFGDKYYLTLKSRGLLSREELEYQINEFDYLKTIKHSVKSIKKTRFLIPIEGTDDKEYEVDLYDDYDFITCEVEFGSEEEAHEFKAPNWCVEDITYDPFYKNANLAKSIN